MKEMKKNEEFWKEFVKHCVKLSKEYYRDFSGLVKDSIENIQKFENFHREFPKLEKYSIH